MRPLTGMLMLVAAQAIASTAIYLPPLMSLDAGWSQHFLRRAINHFNNAEYVYALEELDNALTHAPNPGAAAFAHIYKGRAFYGLKNFAKGKTEFDTAFQLAPESALAYAIAGSTAFKAARFDEADAFFQRGLKASPHHDLLLNNLAWFRATCPDARFRNGAQAVNFAREACEHAQWKDSAFMDTLAAAQAESGDFAGAVATQERALADKDSERLDRSAAERRLHGYMRQQAYHAKPE